MSDSGFIIISLTVLAGSIWLVVRLFRKIARGESGISINAALLGLLAAILLIPFAMNFSAHLISVAMNGSESRMEASVSEAGHH